MPKVIQQKPWQLVTQVGDKPVHEDSEHLDFRGQAHRIVGGQPPLSDNSTGRVYTGDGSEFFPQVFDLKWIKS